MPGLVPGIHVFAVEVRDVDGRDKPGHDGGDNPIKNKTGAEDVGNSTSTTPVRHVSGLNP
jgi:hypothetical protein